MLTHLLIEQKNRFGLDAGSDTSFNRIVNAHHYQRVNSLIEDAIEKGVKHTITDTTDISEETVEDTIQNGVKETIELMNELPNRVKKIIKKGVKDTIQNGVKETQEWSPHPPRRGIPCAFADGGWCTVLLWPWVLPPDRARDR